MLTRWKNPLALALLSLSFLPAAATTKRHGLLSVSAGTAFSLGLSGSEMQLRAGARAELRALDLDALEVALVLPVDGVMRISRPGNGPQIAGRALELMPSVRFGLQLSRNLRLWTEGGAGLQLRDVGLESDPLPNVVLRQARLISRLAVGGEYRLWRGLSLSAQPGLLIDADSGDLAVELWLGAGWRF